MMGENDELFRAGFEGFVGVLYYVRHFGERRLAAQDADFFEGGACA